MKKNLFAPLAVFALAAAILMGGGGCGGGGGSSSNGSDGSNGNPDPNVAVQRLIAIPDGSGITSDFGNLVEGETVTVRVLTIDRTGAGTLSAPTDVRLSAPSSVARLDEDVITAVDATSTTYTVRGNVNGRTLTATLRVSPLGSRVPVTGIVRTAEGVAVPGATVRFYGPSSSEVLASVVSGVDGRYRANVSPEATRFGVDVSDITYFDAEDDELTVYYTVYALAGGLNYDATLGCPAPLPALGSGATLPDAVFRRKTIGSTPPSAPDGCAP